MTLSNTTDNSFIDLSSSTIVPASPSTNTNTITDSFTLPRKRALDGETPMLNKRRHTTRKNCTNYTQACLLLHAIEINRRQSLSPRCIAHLANFVVRAWETDPSELKVRQLYQLMQNLISTTAINQPTLEHALIKFCENTTSTPTPCPSVTLLIAISYIERLNKKYHIIRGTVGCGSRLIMIAYLMAAKFLHDNLRLIIHVPNRSSDSSINSQTSTLRPLLSAATFLTPSVSSMQSALSLPVSPPTSPSRNNLTTSSSVSSTDKRSPPTPPHDTANSSTSSSTLSSLLAPEMTSLSSTLSSSTSSPSQSSHQETTITAPIETTASTLSSPTLPSKNVPANERYLRIMRLELEFLHFLDYDLSAADPAKLVRWANSFDTPDVPLDYCTSADEGDDEMDDHDDDNCTLD